MPQCIGKTKKGLRCRGGAMAGSDFCGPHTDFPTDPPPVKRYFVMDWSDAECTTAYMQEMSKVDGV
jgi:hypothetical protein